MLNRRAFLLALAACAACRGESGPKDPIWGKQPCAHCNMLVSDPLYAAQAESARGDRLFFDDVGCMASYLTEHRGTTKAWVRDAKGNWLEAERARFRLGARTPMDFGVVVDAAGSLDFAAVKERVAAKARGES
ncbi:MAG TPA: hypothetical protein VFQ35_04240 [Polyangiaceae bacterium]|nr:hypothetical protein [Polyangiaceae bacterium]